MSLPNTNKLLSLEWEALATTASLIDLDFGLPRTGWRQATPRIAAF